MNGNKGAVDSNVVILFSKQKIDLDAFYIKYDALYASILTYIEVYAYEFEDKKEKALVDRFFKNVEITELSREIANQTIIYRKSKTKKIKLPSAVILASAKFAAADLITDNYRDFEGIDLSVRVINLDDFKI